MSRPMPRHTRKSVLSLALLCAAAGLFPRWAAAATNNVPGKEPDFKISSKVSLSVPDQAIQQSFRIATDLVAEMRQVAYRHYKYDGWLAVCNGKTDKRPGYDPRDFRYGPKCAAYLWGDDPRLIPEMGKRILLDEHENSGKLRWEYGHGQTAIHIGQVAKHFSDYLRYSEQDKFIQDNWARQLKIIRWTLSEYDRNNDGLIEHGRDVPNWLWAYLVGEPENAFIWDHTQSDVVVVASMEVCEWLQLMADYGAAHQLPETEWLRSKAAQMRTAIETLAYDCDAGYYYLLERAKEKKWYHSGRGIQEESRELDVTPYYAAFVAGNDSRGQKIAEYARKVLLDHGVFPLPLMYPSYYWICPNYPYHGFVPGGCWEESYYNCVRAFVKYGMYDAVYAAIKRRSEAHVRDRDCREWFTPDGVGNGADHYGISAAAHTSAIIEGLFGITPTRFGFDEINIWPAMPASWADSPATIGVALPDGGFLKYTYLLEKKAKTITLTIETDKERRGHLRIPVPGSTRAILWNGKTVLCDMAHRADRQGDVVYLDRSFKRGILKIEYEP